MKIPSICYKVYDAFVGLSFLGRVQVALLSCTVLVAFIVLNVGAMKHQERRHHSEVDYVSVAYGIEFILFTFIFVMYTITVENHYAYWGLLFLQLECLSLLTASCFVGVLATLEAYTRWIVVGLTWLSFLSFLTLQTCVRRTWGWHAYHIAGSDPRALALYKKYQLFSASLIMDACHTIFFITAEEMIVRHDDGNAHAGGGWQAGNHSFPLPPPTRLNHSNSSGIFSLSSGGSLSSGSGGVYTSSSSSSAQSSSSFIHVADWQRGVLCGVCLLTVLLARPLQKFLRSEKFGVAVAMAAVVYLPTFAIEMIFAISSTITAVDGSTPVVGLAGDVQIASMQRIQIAVTEICAVFVRLVFLVCFAQVTVVLVVATQDQAGAAAGMGDDHTESHYTRRSTKGVEDDEVYDDLLNSTKKSSNSPTGGSGGAKGKSLLRKIEKAGKQRESEYLIDPSAVPASSRKSLSIGKHYYGSTTGGSLQPPAGPSSGGHTTGTTASYSSCSTATAATDHSTAVLSSRGIRGAIVAGKAGGSGGGLSPRVRAPVYEDVQDASQPRSGVVVVHHATSSGSPRGLGGGGRVGPVGGAGTGGGSPNALRPRSGSSSNTWGTTTTSGGGSFPSSQHYQQHRSHQSSPRQQLSPQHHHQQHHVNPPVPHPPPRKLSPQTSPQLLPGSSPAVSINGDDEE